jgi:6-phosphofructokinase 1
MDVQSLPQPVSIYETMGRSTGWLAGASLLAKDDEKQAPHLVDLPERPFEMERFLADLDRVVTKLGWAVVVATEGLVDASGHPVYESAMAAQLDALSRPLPGGIAAHLAEVASQRLGIRCRWEKPGLCGRASVLHVSPQDRDDAERVGRAAVRAAMAGESDVMVSLRPLDARDHETCDLVPLAKVANGDRRIPPEWLGDSAHAAVSPQFLRYVRPIVGGLVDYATPLMDQWPSPASLQKESV